MENVVKLVHTKKVYGMNYTQRKLMELEDRYLSSEPKLYLLTFKGEDGEYNTKSCIGNTPFEAFKMYRLVKGEDYTVREELLSIHREGFTKWERDDIMLEQYIPYLYDLGIRVKIEPKETIFQRIRKLVRK